MPIYEYQCQSCDHRFEAIQKMTEDRLTDCPVCHEAALKKLVSAAAFKLKGGGWYETDFKHGQKGAKAGSDKASSDNAGDTKPAAKASDTSGAGANEKTSTNSSSSKSDAKTS